MEQNDPPSLDTGPILGSEDGSTSSTTNNRDRADSFRSAHSSDHEESPHRDDDAPDRNCNSLVSSLSIPAEVTTMMSSFLDIFSGMQHEIRELSTEVRNLKDTLDRTNSQMANHSSEAEEKCEVVRHEDYDEGIPPHLTLDKSLPAIIEEGSTPPPKKSSEKLDLRSSALRPYVIISTSYLLFTITDGAIRMIVLLHAYNKMFSAFEVAVMFTLYELAGVFTNLAAGLMGAKWGIRKTLIGGLCLQIFSYGLLFGWNDDWSKSSAIIYVTIAQMFAGIAKDLTKLGGKTVTKLVTPDEQQTRLFRLVSLITGFKNSMKGIGYFLGSALISVSYYASLSVMIVLIVLAMPWAIFGLDDELGTAKKKNASIKEIFKLDNFNLNVLSLARLFLFASRDFWFEVPLPFYLRSPSCEGLGSDPCQVDGDCDGGAVCDAGLGVCANFNPGGGCGGTGLSRVVVGTFLGGYIILYGQVQSWTPQLVTKPLGQNPPNKLAEVLWGSINCIPTAVMAIVLSESYAFATNDKGAMIAWLVTVIVSFAVIFAINSSIHSYLVVKYAKSDKVAASVGFYYMSNAMGRLMGTLLSGVLYTYVGEYLGPMAGNDGTAGLAACFIAGTLSSALAAGITVWIKDEDAGLKCGSWVCVRGVDVVETEDKEDNNADMQGTEHSGKQSEHSSVK